MSDFDQTRLYADIADRDDTIEQQRQRIDELTSKIDFIKHKVEIDATKEVVLSVINNKEKRQ